MSSRRCVVDNCAYKQVERSVSFHCLPVHQALKDKWITNCKINSEIANSKSILVCSLHFHRADFQLTKNGKYRLKQGTVPTIFPWNKCSTTTTSTNCNQQQDIGIGQSAEIERSSTLTL